LTADGNTTIELASGTLYQSEDRWFGFSGDVTVTGSGNLVYNKNVERTHTRSGLGVTAYLATGKIKTGFDGWTSPAPTEGAIAKSGGIFASDM
jgi:hypothetical protein